MAEPAGPVHLSRPRADRRATGNRRTASNTARQCGRASQLTRESPAEAGLRFSLEDDAQTLQYETTPMGRWEEGEPRRYIMHLRISSSAVLVIYLNQRWPAPLGAA